MNQNSNETHINNKLKILELYRQKNHTEKWM